MDKWKTTGKYILKNKTPVPCNDLKEWAAWMETHSRRIARITIGDAEISTVFMGLDYNFSMKGDPILFETMIFGGEHAEYCERYSTLEEAIKGHRRAIEKVRGK